MNKTAGNNGNVIVVLSRCVICSTGHMQNSKDGVTCGDLICQMELPDYLVDMESILKEELKDELKEIEKELKDEVNECREELIKVKEALQYLSLKGVQNIISDLDLQIETSLSKFKDFFKKD